MAAAAVVTEAAVVLSSAGATTATTATAGTNGPNRKGCERSRALAKGTTESLPVARAKVPQQC